MAEDSDTPTARRPKLTLPDGYDGEDDFLEEMRTLFADDVTFDSENRDAAQEDAKFMVGDQWEDSIRQRRENARKPIITVNRLPAFVAQIIGNRRLNETAIKVLPDSGGSKPSAQVREDLIRSIEQISKAERAYDAAMEGQVIGGIGNFAVGIDYTNDDVFEQEIRIVRLPDPLAVVWDRTLLEPTGADADHCFVCERVTHKEYKRRWPWAQPADADSAIYPDGVRSGSWVTQDDVRIVSYWRMRHEKRRLALLTDGTTKDITDTDAYDAMVATRKDGTPYIREVNKPYAQMYLCSGLNVLEGPYNLPIDRVPVFRVPGWEVRIGDRLHRWGLIRFLKDPQRLHNYWRSVIAEKLMLTPKAKWIASDTSVAGRENAWRQAHISDDPLLIWNADSGQPPIPSPPAQLEQALITEAQMGAQDMRDVSNLHEANLGMPSNEVSGKAILARQRIGDLGTVIFHDNLNDAIAECGRVINQLLPVVYDTPRIVKIIGADGKEKLQAINGIVADAPDITTGKYSVTLTTGPSYLTRRIEASESLLSLINSVPQIGQVAADILVSLMDFDKGSMLERRLRKMLPPGLLDPEDMTPEERAQAAAAAQQHAAQEEVAKQVGALKAQKLQSDSTLNFARARREMALADKAGVDSETQRANAISEIHARSSKSIVDFMKVGQGKP